MRSAVGVLSHRVMAAQVKRDDEGAGAVRGWQRQRLPAAPAQAQRGVLELRFGRGQRRGEFAEHLGVRVQSVARGAPRLV